MDQSNRTGPAGPVQGGLDHPPPFPSQAVVRGVFARYCDIVSKTTEASLDAVFGAMLAATSALLGRGAMLPWAGKAMPAAVNVLLLAFTGQKKSTALDDAEELLVEPMRPRSAATWEPEPLVVVSGAGSGEGFAEAIKDEVRWPPGADRKKEAARVFAGRRGIYFIHELGSLFHKIARDSAGNMTEFLLRSFDAPSNWTHQTRRHGDADGAFKITNGLAVIAAASTPEYLLGNLTTEMVMAGLLNRFVLFYGPPGLPLHIRPSFDHTRLAKFHDDLRACFAAVWGKPFALSPEADEVHKHYYLRQEWRRGDSELVVAAVARTDVIALRVAMLLALADKTTLIARAHVEGGWALANYSGAIARALVSRMRDGTKRQVEDRVRSAARRVAANGTLSRFTRRAVWQRVKGPHGMSSEDFNKSWTALVTAGDIRPLGEGWFMLGWDEPIADIEASAQGVPSSAAPDNPMQPPSIEPATPPQVPLLQDLQDQMAARRATWSPPQRISVPATVDLAAVGDVCRLCGRDDCPGPEVHEEDN